MIKDGPHFSATVKALELEGSQRRATERNAANIVEAVIEAYGVVAKDRIDLKKVPKKPVTGLVYGRIQSGQNTCHDCQHSDGI